MSLSGRLFLGALTEGEVSMCPVPLGLPYRRLGRVAGPAASQQTEQRQRLRQGYWGGV